MLGARVLGIGAGLAGLAVFATLRRWLPDRSIIAGLVGVAIGAGVLVRPSGLISSESVDFALVDPVVLAVAMGVAMVVLYGATVGVLVDYLAPRWPQPGWSPRGIFSVLPFAALVLSPPLFIAAGIAVLIGSVIPKLRPAAGPDARPSDHAVTSRLTRAAVAAAGALGAASVLVAAVQVLAL